MVALVVVALIVSIVSLAGGLSLLAASDARSRAWRPAAASQRRWNRPPVPTCSPTRFAS
jgi:type II secretory pathway pseudopilin PulG